MNLSVPPANQPFVLTLPEDLEPIPEAEVERLRTAFRDEMNNPGPLMVVPHGTTLAPLQSDPVWSVKMFFMLASQEERDLVTAILNEPKDGAGRLVYADWLEEHGRMAEAESERASSNPRSN